MKKQNHIYYYVSGDHFVRVLIRSIYNKILIQHYFWPNVQTDVSKHYHLCHKCQMVGMPNQTVPKAQLHTILAIGQPL